MIAQLIWFAAGFMTSAIYWDELKKLFYEIEAKVTDTDGTPVDFGAMKKKIREEYIQNLVNNSLRIVGLDTRDVNFNKTLSQITRALSEAYDKPGKPGTQEFMRAWYAKKDLPDRRNRRKEVVPPWEK